MKILIISYLCIQFYHSQEIALSDETIIEETRFENIDHLDDLLSVEVADYASIDLDMHNDVGEVSIDYNSDAQANDPRNHPDTHVDQVDHSAIVYDNLHNQADYASIDHDTFTHIDLIRDNSSIEQAGHLTIDLDSQTQANDPFMDDSLIMDHNDDEDFSLHDQEAINEILSVQKLEEEEIRQEELLAANDSVIAMEAERRANEQEAKERDEQRRQQASDRYHSSASSIDSSNINGQSTTGPLSPKSHQLGGNKVSMKSSSTSTPATDSKSASYTQSTTTKPQLSFQDLLNRFNSKSEAASSSTSPESEQSPSSTRRPSSMSRLESLLQSQSATRGGGVDDAKSKQKKQVLLQRLRRYEYPRAVARPIENIITCYEDERKSYYDLFQIKYDGDDKTIDSFKLRQIYRNLALQVHPDKNSHPDAKYAFDILRDAYDTLSSESNRLDYNQQLRSSANRKKLTWKKFKKNLRNQWINSHARWLQFIYRLHHGEIKAEIEELFETPKALVKGWYHKIQHLYLLPSAYDRIAYLHEILFNHLSVVWLWIELIAWLFEKQLLTLTIL